MPLHDWAERTEWEGVRIYWMGEIAQWLKPRLPKGYRAIIGSSPFAHIGVSLGKPDVSVTKNGPASPPPSNSPSRTSSDSLQPDYETVVATLEEDRTVLIEKDNRLVSAIEIISPANKDRPDRRSQYGARYLGYLRAGVHLLLIDVHARPFQFSFAQLIAAELQIVDRPAPPTPQAASYQVGAGAPFGGRFLAVWQRTLAIASALPSIPIAISVEDIVSVDLESTYMEAARKAYVED